MKRFLIIGGETFIGANIARRLVREGKEVHVITHQTPSLWRLKDLMLSIRIHSTDLSNSQDVFEVLNKIKAAVIINTTAYGERAHEVDLDETYDYNFFNLLVLMEQAKEVGFSCFINTGTYQEYGRKAYALSESVMPEPLSHYGISKAAATMYCTKEVKKNSLPIYTIRPFIPYGPYQGRDSFITKLFTNTMIDVKFNHYYANAAYDFIYIDDLVNIYLALAQQLPTTAYIFNAGSGISYKLRDVVRAFEEIWQHDVTIDWNLYSDIGFSVESQSNCFADQTITNTILRNLPQQKSLKEGLKATFEWFMKNQLLYEDSQLDLRHQMLSL